MTKRVIGVRFRKAGRMYYFDPGEFEIAEGDGVIVETSRGMEYGDVVLSPHEVPEEQIVAPLKEVLRKATADDQETHERNMQMEREAFDICTEKIAQHGLDMKLVDVEYTFNGSKITFYFTAEGRIDFRELVKDLAFVFKTRIELRQIGVRDEAKMLGGLGSCGLPVCCKTFLEDFQPVSIKMAKEQKLSLSPTKISGLCGRLMCCLKYEQDAYESMRKLMPRANKEVITPDGRGVVLDNNVITEKTKVRIALPDGTFDVREYHYSIIRKPGTPEEEEALRLELQESAKALAREEAPEEEEFRFVTGHTVEPRPLPEEPDPNETDAAPARPADGQAQRTQAPYAPPKPRQDQRPNRPPQDRFQQRPRQDRPPQRPGEQQKQPRPQQDRPQQEKPQRDDAEAAGAQPKPHRSHRGSHNRRRRPQGSDAARPGESQGE